MPDAALVAAQGYRLQHFAFPALAEPAPPPLPHGTILAFDFGERRVGVAVGETAIGVAHPLTTIEARDAETRFAAIAALVAEWRPAGFVVGLPVHMDGAEHAMTAHARRFARQLEGRSKLPVRLIDERLTTHEASLLLREAGVRTRHAKPVRDQVAAQQILQAYFDAAVDG